MENLNVPFQAVILICKAARCYEIVIFLKVSECLKNKLRYWLNIYILLLFTLFYSSLWLPLAQVGSFPKQDELHSKWLEGEKQENAWTANLFSF